MSEYKYDLRPAEAERLLEGLLKLKTNGPRDKSCGLCTVLSYETTEVLPRGLMQWWPEHSGNLSYPVPHPRYNPAYGYMTCHNKWDRRTAYGKARWRLVDFLIEKLKEIVNDC